jgi:predicted PurR-regulated permease PerM
MNNALVLNPPLAILRNIFLKIKFSLKMFWILSFVLVIAFLVSYIIQVNSLAKETYQIQDYQQKIGKISQENESLLSNALKESSLSNIETIIKDLSFERTQKIHYIQVLDRQVVTK